MRRRAAAVEVGDRAHERAGGADGQQLTNLTPDTGQPVGPVGQTGERGRRGAGLVREDVTAVQFQMGLAVTTRPLPAAAHALVPDVGGWLVEVYLRGLRPD